MININYLCVDMRKKINIQKGAVLGAILTTIVAGNVAFRGTGCRETTVAVGGEIVAGRRMGSNCAGSSFRWMAIFADVRPETTRRVAETYLATLLDRVL